MKTKAVVIAMSSLLPLIAAGVLGLVGITFGVWTYVLLAVVCPAVGVTLWLFYKHTEKEISRGK